MKFYKFQAILISNNCTAVIEFFQLMTEKENTVLVEECGNNEVFDKQPKNSFLTRSGTWKINNGLLTCLFQIYPKSEAH